MICKKLQDGCPEVQKISPKFLENLNPKIGLIALASDYMIEKDFISVIKDKKIDFFVNRIETYNPLTAENLIKMSETITEVTKIFFLMKK